jgi:hypothetical protein
MHRYGDIGVVGEVLSNRHPFAKILTTSCNINLSYCCEQTLGLKLERRNISSGQ